MIQQIRNECLNLVRPANRHIGRVNISSNETLEHATKKADICLNLKIQGKQFLTEAIFKDGSGRADILVLDDFKVIEVVCTEKEESIIMKKNKYPKGLKIEVVKA